MRPRKLTFAGFGSYPGREEIDFDALGEKGLYLIVGPTGAGKTTLLDAVTYALYATVAQDRENAVISNHPGRLAPMVEFEFSQGDRNYVVHREPALPGKTPSPARQWMKELDHTGAEISSVTGTRNVTNLAEEVVGLTAEEFMQVILLPQGKFQQFLMARGSDKQRMLQTIFGTGVYRRIVERLDNSAKDLKARADRSRGDLDAQRAVVSAALASLTAHEWSTEIPDAEENLEAAVEYLNTKSVGLDATKTRSESARTAAQTAFDDASREADRFGKAEIRRLLQEQNDAIEPDVELARRCITEHEDADPVVNADSTRADKEQTADSLDTRVADIRASISGGLTRLPAAHDSAVRIAQGVSTMSPGELRAAFAVLHGALDTASQAHLDIENLNTAIDDAAKELAEVNTELTETEGILSNAKNDKKRLAGELRKARKTADGLLAATKAVTDLDNLLEKSDVEGATEALNSANGVLGEAQKKFDDAERTYRKAMELHNAELTGILASQLVTGEPCPVCGSTEHPHKAKRPGKAARGPEAAEKARDRALKAKTDAEHSQREAQKALEAAQAHHSELPPPDKQVAMRARLTDITAAADSVDGLDSDVTAADEMIEEIQAKVNGLKTRRTELTAADKSNRTQLTKAQTAVADIGSAEEVDDSITQCEHIEGLLKALESETDKATGARAEAQQASSMLEEALKKSPFVKVDDAKQCILDPSLLEKLRGTVQGFADRQVDIGKLDAAIGAEPLPDIRPDPESLKGKLNEAQHAADAAAAEATTVHTVLEQLSNARTAIGRLGAELEENTRRAELAVSIAKVFKDGSGGPSGQLSLEVWVQRTLFEEVCLVANEQLRSLSSNRYSLTLEQQEGGVTKRRGSGLDLYVLDSHTGTTRPVQTMSGGEQFIASLALALALAEVVQRHAGGIELPCLFIDEGFGGLDLESLDLAIDVLARLQASGRTVGIITHVEAMQQQLPTGIRVNKSDSGSTLEVCV